MAVANDDFIAVFMWPPTVWMAKGNDLDDFEGPDNFTIHGLWTAKVTSTGKLSAVHTGGLQGRGKLTLAEIPGEMIGELQTKWPNIQDPNDNIRFWAGEWKRHGQGTNLNKIEYLRKALDLYDQTDVLGFLRAHGIHPGSSHTAEEFANAMEYGTGRKCRIECELINGKKYISNIWVLHDHIYGGRVGCQASEVYKNCSSTDIIYFEAK